jgi:hypothetical protein
MNDAIARYRAASEANDIDALMQTLMLGPKVARHPSVLLRALRHP